jgi:methionine sulfoxide reductase heme-binding subunit
MTLLDRIKRLPFTPLQFAVHFYAWYGLVVLVYDFLIHKLTANPLQFIQQQTGLHAVTLLTLSLACRPLSDLLGWRELLKHSRTLGLYAFMVAILHILIFLDLDNGIAWNFFAQTIIEKWYIIFGITTFLLLIPLAMTSFDIWKVRLQKKWKRLHQLIYIIVPIAVLHYALSKKGDLFHLQGDIVQPFIYGVVVCVLLALRLPFIRRFIISFRTRIVLLFGRMIPQPTPRP